MDGGYSVDLASNAIRTTEFWCSVQYSCQLLSTDDMARSQGKGCSAILVPVKS
jgi:hypothetical protein